MHSQVRCGVVHPRGGCPLTVSFRDAPETGLHAVTVHVCALSCTWLHGSDSTQGTVDSIGHMETLVVIWRNNHRTDSGTHRSLCETHLSRNSADHPISTGPCSGGQSGVWGSLKPISVQSQCPVAPEKSALPQWSYPEKRRLVPLRKTGRKIMVYILGSSLESFLKETQPLLRSWSYGLVNWLHLSGISPNLWASPVAQLVKDLPAVQES